MATFDIVIGNDVESGFDIKIGTSTVRAQLAATLDNATLVATAINRASAATTATLANATLVATAQNLAKATTTATLAPATLVATAKNLAKASTTSTLANATLLATATNLAKAATTATLANATIVATAISRARAVLPGLPATSTQLADATLVATAKAPAHATLTATLANATSSANADIISRATLGATLADVTLVGTATAKFVTRATMTATLEDAVLSRGEFIVANGSGGGAGTNTFVMMPGGGVRWGRRRAEISPVPVLKVGTRIEFVGRFLDERDDPMTPAIVTAEVTTRAGRIDYTTSEVRNIARGSYAITVLLTSPGAVTVRFTARSPFVQSDDVFLVTEGDRGELSVFDKGAPHDATEAWLAAEGVRVKRRSDTLDELRELGAPVDEDRPDEYLEGQLVAWRRIKSESTHASREKKWK